MRYLLDTHIWLWSLLAPDRLSPEIIDVFENENNEFFISPITIWETLVLAQKGRIELSLPPEEWIAEALERTPVHEALLSNEIAVKSTLIELPHKDPADRFIAATAWENDMILITEDRNLRMSHQIKVFGDKR